MKRYVSISSRADVSSLPPTYPLPTPSAMMDFARHTKIRTRPNPSFSRFDIVEDYRRVEFSRITITRRYIKLNNKFEKQVEKIYTSHTRERCGQAE